MNTVYLPGRGDPETWPPCEGHPNDPRTDVPDGWIDELAAEEQALDEFMRTPYSIAWWLLNDECAKDLSAQYASENPLNTEVLSKRLLANDALSAPELLALVFGGPSLTIMLAVKKLRDGLYAAARSLYRDEIADRTAQIMRQNNREEEF